MIATYLRKMLTLACVAAVLPACLITDRKDYEAAPSLRPSIRTDATTSGPQLGRIIVLNDIGSLDGGSGDLLFEVIINEPNVNDPIDVRVLVNMPLGTMDTVEAGRFVRGSGSAPVTSPPAADRRFEFFILRRDLDQLRCNKIEIIVASRFKDRFTPVDLDESAHAVWWAGPLGADLAACL